MSHQYTCPMHPEAIQDHPGNCPKCGMKLVPAGSSSSTSTHMAHDHQQMMMQPDAASDFLKRFIIVTLFLIPLAIISQPLVQLLNLPEFAGRLLLQFVLATAIFYWGLIFFQHAQHEIKSKQYGMMTLVSLGVGAGYLFSVLATFVPVFETEFYLEISSLIWILLFGHFLEAKSAGAAGDALAQVSKLLPKQAHLKTKHGVTEVAIEQLQVGDRVVVKAGEKVPADGVIVVGESSFDQSHLTGESQPVFRKKDQLVAAGSINLDTTVEITLEKIGDNSTVGQIKALIATAKQTKPSVQRLADRAASWLTLAALTVSILTFLVWSLVLGQSLVFALTLSITVLVIACPHALGLAIPTVSTLATRLAVKNGIFIKDMSKIELIRKVSYVVFDKTGTLTQGKFEVDQVKILHGSSDKLLPMIAAIESNSAHVIGQSLTKYLTKKSKLPNATQVKNLAGMGVRGVVKGKQYWIGNQRLMNKIKVWQPALTQLENKLIKQGKSLVFVADAKQVLAVISLSDNLKVTAKAAIQQLHQLGIKVAMLTGDTTEIASAVAKKLEIDQFFAQVLPQDKYKYVQQLQDQGQVVLMAGDGVNDAPALTQSDVGVAIGSGTDVAVEAGDVVLVESNPQHVVRLILLSKRVYTKMIENLWWALGYNIVAIPAAAGLFIPFGFKLTPAVGALLMSLSSVIVVANALSLRDIK